MGKLFFNFRVDEGFLTMTQDIETIKENIKHAHIKIEISCDTKYKK